MRIKYFQYFLNMCICILSVSLSVGLLATTYTETDMEKLEETLRSLIGNTYHMKKILIVVFFNSVSDDDNEQNAQTIADLYPDLLDKSTIQLILVPYSVRKVWLENNVVGPYGHLPELVAKENLDRAFLYRYCTDVSENFIEVQSGDLSIRHYDKKILTFLHSLKKSFYQIQFTNSRTTGILFPSGVLRYFSNIIFKSHDELPTRKILLSYGDRILYGKTPVIKSPSTAQHRNNDDLRHDIISNLIRENKTNPRALISTDMPPYENYDSANAYDRDDFTFFWTSEVDVGNYFQIIFTSSQNVSRVVVTTGNYINKDQLKDGVLTLGRVYSNMTADCDSIVEQWTFAHGMVDTRGEDEYIYGGIVCLEIRVLSRQHDWLMIRDIYVS